jgi:predicted transcriptional regulator
VLVVRSTSKGVVVLQFQNWNWGFDVSICTLDETGWVEEKERWRSRDEEGRPVDSDDQPRLLGEAISQGVDLPMAEAKKLATSTIQEWQQRGGKEEGRGDTVKGFALITAIGVVIILAIAALVGLVVFIATNVL